MLQSRPSCSLRLDRARQDVGADRRGVLVVRVVVADDDDVGEARGDGAHGRALALVALSGGAKDDDHPGPRFRGADGFQCAGQGVGVVGKVDHRGGGGGDELHAAGDGDGEGVAGVEGGLDGGGIVAAREHHDGCQRGVGHVEAAGQAGVDAQFRAVAVAEGEVGAESARGRGR